MTDTNRDAHAVSGVSEVERARMALRAIRLEVVPAIADDLTMIVEAAFAALAQPTDEAVIKRIKREAARLHLGGNSSPTDQQRLAATRFVEGAKFALAQSSGRGADHAGKKVSLRRAVDIIRALGICDETGHVRACGYEDGGCSCISLPTRLADALAADEGQRCQHVFPDGTRCPMAVDDHRRIPGLAEAHAVDEGQGR